MDIINKKCFKCGEVKPLSAFYKHPQTADGHIGKCKECTKKDSIDNRWNNREYYKKYDRERGCRMTPEYYKKYHKKRPGIYNCARDIPKQPCAVCGYDGYVEAHHEDYGKPREVTWLCYQHHNSIHGKLLF